jgi:sec-independent protein translocase protein TatB
MSKLRRLTTEVRAQTGIDEVLRQEGIEGGLVELRSMMRGDFSALQREQRRAPPPQDPYREPVELDRSREYPPEGVDAAYALADDLVDDEQPAETAPPADTTSVGQPGQRPAAADTTAAAPEVAAAKSEPTAIPAPQEGVSSKALHE